PVTNAQPLLAGGWLQSAEFQQVEGRAGHYVGEIADAKRRWLRVTSPGLDGRRWFSDLIDIDAPQENDAAGAIVARLHPGVRLSGRLDDAIPRPIRIGRVELCVVEGANQTIPLQDGWKWVDSAQVRADGSFEFPSVPAGGHAQLFALAEGSDGKGYHSICPPAEELRDYLAAHDAGETDLIVPAVQRDFWPQLFPLPENAYDRSIILPCTPAGAVDVQVVDPQGQPLAGATVQFNPNCFCLGNRVILPCHEMSSARLLGDLTEETKWARETFYEVRSDEKGVAHVRNLPAKRQQSYQVEAPGYVLPSDPTSSPDFETRYAVLTTESGQVLRRTVTMERYIATAPRDLAVVDAEGRPLPNLEVTVAELAYADAPDDWQMWSVQRFGTQPAGTSDATGQVRLKVPTEAEGRRVTSFRVIVAGRITNPPRDAYAQRQRLAVAAEDDGRSIVVQISDELPAEPNAFLAVNLAYARLDELGAEATSLRQLQQLEKTPSIALLKQLLAASDFHSHAPLEFRAERNLLEAFNGPASPVARVSIGDAERVVVLCRVRPHDADWAVKPPLRFAPEAAFVFDPADGSLIKMIGGWQSERGDYCSVMLTDLGVPGDYFVETSAFDDLAPFEYLQKWTRLGHEESPALVVHGYANASSWSADAHEGSLSAEFGFTGYSFNSRNLDDKLPGQVAGGAAAPRKLYWDGRLKRFLGASQMTCEGKPLYRVITDESPAFQEVAIDPNELIVAGGRRSFEQWLLWDVLVPEGRTATLTLELSPGDPEAEQLAATAQWKLTAGVHMLQLHLDPTDDADFMDAEVRIDDQRLRPEFKIPIIDVASLSSAPGLPVLRHSPDDALLVAFPAEDGDAQLVGRVILDKP
ncbi:MAG: hypothetical protein KDA61_21690, partial [Planctomycetales bacterium]|nr:hypothetical protein [Planctomycetales bacterium]